ncbi:hypothetical protein EV193_102555 [Herbihabitans rhizosphaerae]|uniref:Uncharacterized protein n=1 Tax=Herbihabitans rhizosphaerae TaxID=1872711 RepID=A0A4Q7L2W9_9PSEU|nr:hypothetical protein [Herbihabitans rhizosphaerae]RZS43575.1 hypothetical protein EV193_102555 [Herbihabitans rhizosphaerae]
MTTRDRSLAEVIVKGLTAPVTETERDRLLRELESRLPTDGDGPLTVTRIHGTPVAYRGVVRSLGKPDRFDFGDATCALLAVGALDDTDVDALIEHVPSYCGVRRQQVLNRLAAGDLAGARAAADLIADGRSWVGYRDIGTVLAERGDVDEFFGDWKRYVAGKDRDGMVVLKKKLITAVARDEGWQAALAVTKDKRVGSAFAKFAFAGFPAVGDVAGLRRVFAGDATGVLSEIDQLSMLAQTVRAASGHNPDRDHPLLDEIVNRIIAVDPTTDKATMRWRDAELFALWPAFGERSTLDRVRAAIRTPRYRRELTKLPREFP